MRSLNLGLWALAGIGFTACAAAVTSTKQAPETPGATTFTQAPAGTPEALRTLEEAEAALERARAELSAIALSQEPAPVTAGAAAPTAYPTPSPAAPPPVAERRVEEKSAAAASEERDEASMEERAVSPCETACRAFGSLLRARDAVCRLEEPRGARCERAEGIVRDARGHVRSCSCPP